MASSSVIDPVPPLTTRWRLAAQTWAFKAVITIVLNISRVLAPSVYKKYSPTYIKKYSVRPTLECRFFIPKTFQSGSLLPLYVDIHGGGFFAGDAQIDDKICHYLCNKFNYLVVSIQYRLAPAHPFPVPVDDCTELVLAILSDPDLPFDRKRVAMGGQSAGGSLALAVSQDGRLRSNIKALVTFYPATDFSHKFMGDYRDKPAGPNGKGAESDGLRSVVPLAEWAYPPYGQDRTDPRMSPVYADPTALPKHIYVITAQYDKLCQEAFSMAQKLARHETAKEEEDWDVNGIRWERLPNEVHGFIEAGWRAELFGGSDLPWTKEVEDVLGRVSEWLEKVFKTTL